jgi:thiosulfate/3-mercaptopyruvate sulfurtransferase
MMTSILLAVHLAAAQPAPQLLVEPEHPKLSKDFHLLDVRGKAKYEEGHLPGAALAETGPWSKALTAGKADAAFWKAELAKVGVSPQKPVVVYSDDPRDAARTWWMLKHAGVPDVRILNGGWKAYTAAKLPVEKETVTARALPHDWTPAHERLADKKHVLEQLKADAVIVDTRTKEEHAGESKLAKKAGHIPGSVHLEWSELLDPKTGKYLPQPELLKLVKDRRIDLDKPVITYCQSGGRAAVGAFGLELAGAKRVRNYYASWGEWGNADDTPVALPKK